MPCGASAPSPLPAPGPREPRPSPLRASGTSVSPSLQPAPLLRLPRQPQRPGPPPAPFPLHPQGPRTPSGPTPAAPAPPPARPGPAQSRSQAPPSVPAPVPDAAASRDRRSGPRSRAARSSPRECWRRRDRDFRELRARGAGNAGAGGAGTGARGAAASLEKGTVRKHARRDEGSAVPERGGSQSPSRCRPGVREEGTGVGCTAPALPPSPKGTVRVPRHTCVNTQARLPVFSRRSPRKGRTQVCPLAAGPSRVLPSAAVQRAGSVGRAWRAPGVDADPSPRKARQCWLRRWGRAPPRVPLMGKLRPEAARGRVLEVPGTDRGAHGETEAVPRSGS